MSNLFRSLSTIYRQKAYPNYGPLILIFSSPWGFLPYSRDERKGSPGKVSGHSKRF